MGGCFIFDTASYAAVGYRCNFSLAALADKRIDANIPTPLGGMTLAYQHHGNTDYHEQQVGVGFTIRTSSWLHVGVAADYLHLGTSDPHYENQQWVRAAAHIVVRLPEDVTLYACGASRQWDKAKPWMAVASLQYRLTPGWTTMLGAESDDRFRLRAGAEYLYSGTFAFRTGFSTAPFTATFGIGLNLKALSIDLSTETHSQLGITPHISMLLWF